MLKDYFGKDATRLQSKKLVLLDMDGTIYRENDLFDGVKEFLAEITRRGGRYAFITNNPSKSVQDYVKKLRKMGIEEVDETNFFTSAQAAIMIMQERFGKSLIYAQGTRSFIKGLKRAGLNVTEKYTQNAAAILVAFDPELTGKKLRTTSEMLTKHDVPYYATNPDWVCPVEFGSVPDCGSMCVGYRYATGKTPIFIGKPEPAMVLELMKKFSANKEDTVVIGDRLYTDVASGVNAGVDTVLVLSGEATLQDLNESDVKPTFVLNSVADIYANETWAAAKKQTR